MPMPCLDNDADAALKLANEIAHEFELEYVGTEHILLAILRHNKGLGPKVLRAFKIDESRARKEIDLLMQHDKEDTWVFGRLPISRPPSLLDPCYSANLSSLVQSKPFAAGRQI